MIKNAVGRVGVIGGVLRKFFSKNSTTLDDHVGEVLRSRHFDHIYYGGAAGQSFSTPSEAAEHYLLSGEALNIRPSSTFDPAYYARVHRDLESLPYPLIIHYIRHGEAEQRFAISPLERHLSTGRKPLDSSKPTCIVAVHEMSRTGAPILGLNLVQSLSKNFNVIVVARRGGDLLDFFLDQAAFVFSPQTGWLHDEASVLASDIISPLAESYGISFAIVNSVEAAAFAAACHISEVPCVTLIHEFSDYVLPVSKITDAIGYSARVVFSSKLTQASFVSHWCFTQKVTNSVVIPQGKCIPPAADAEGKGVKGEALQKDNRMLVIGCGAVQIRKGVDLFIATASAVVKELGTDKVRFVWVGSGYGPDGDGMWLKAQIDRSDLGDAFEFLGELGADELEKVYRDADLMFLSSRLDPFPNVAIDAMHAGLPIVAFAKASGVADYLEGIDGVRHAVVPHLDLGAATRQIVTLLQDHEQRKAISRELQKLARRDFVFEDYVDRILEQVAIAKEALEKENEEARILLASKLFEKGLSWVGEPPTTVYETVRAYVRLSASGAFPAEPRIVPGLNIYDYAQMVQPSGNPLAHWTREGRRPGPWLRQVRMIEGGPRASSLSVAVHIHLHHDAPLAKILDGLKVNRTRPDVFVTLSNPDIKENVGCALKISGLRHQLSVVENRGRDVGHFLSLLSSDLKDYDVVAHLHGKKSEHIGSSDFVGRWFEFLIGTLAGGDAPSLDLIAQMFEADTALGLVFPEDPFICGWGSNKIEAEKLAAQLDIADLPSTPEFPVGNMFFARPAAFRRLIDAKLSLQDMPAEPVGRDGTMLHALERLMPTICNASGFGWETVLVPGLHR